MASSVKKPLSYLFHPKLFDESFFEWKRNHTMNKKLSFVLASILVLSLILAGCAPAAPVTEVVEATAIPATEAPAPTEAPTTRPAPANVNLILATTTSTQDSGLLDVLIPMFEAEYGYVVQTVAVGSGAAIKMGQEGNADVLLVHSPAAEKTFMADGWGKDRSLIMHNDFIVVGPEADPAGIKGLTAAEAFAKIFAAGTEKPESVVFVARADESGTSTKELGIWKKAELDPAGSKPAWYVETGQGMGASLTIASEKGGYILADRATYLANKANLSLVILSEGDNSLLNIYHVMTVDTAKWPKVNYQGATDFMSFMLSETTQAEIEKFGVDKYGQSLFIPDGTKTDADYGL
jgi:tungstate transport system substrate-binding protein